METPTVLIGEASRMLGVSVESVRGWERAGRLTAVRTSGGVRLFDRSAVERLAAERTRQRGDAAGAGAAR